MHKHYENIVLSFMKPKRWYLSSDLQTVLPYIGDIGGNLFSMY